MKAMPVEQYATKPDPPSGDLDDAVIRLAL